MKLACTLSHSRSGAVDGLPGGKNAVAECADCGILVCLECREPCCGESLGPACYDYPRKAVRQVFGSVVVRVDFSSAIVKGGTCSVYASAGYLAVAEASRRSSAVLSLASPSASVSIRLR